MVILLMIDHGFLNALMSIFMMKTNVFFHIKTYKMHLCYMDILQCLFFAAGASLA